MKLTVLVDNNTVLGESYHGEPGLCFLIEEEDQKILFDLGYSDVFLRNAYKMGISLGDVNRIIFSHGHLDHTWGLTHLMQSLKPEAYQRPERKISILTHPLALCPKLDDGEPIGFIHSEDLIRKCFHLELSEAPVWITENLVYLGQIERTHDFENKRPLGTTVINGQENADFILDDSALVYRSSRGLVIITGCSHSGICNIVAYAKKVCEEDKVADIIGGFHLLNPSAEQLEGTLIFLEKLAPESVYACHCTDLNSKIALAQVAKVREVGVGLKLEYK